jgi:hypothetical protein
VSPLRFILVGLLFVAMTAYPLKRGLHTGVIHLRGPHGRVERRKNPIRYWTAIAVTALVLVLGIGMTLWGFVGAIGLR